MQSATPTSTSPSHDAVIRVYDEAGNVIENARTRSRIQRTVAQICSHESSGRLLIGLGSFTDYSGRFAVQVGSLLTVRSLSEGPQ